LQYRHSRFEAKDAFKRYVLGCKPLSGISSESIGYLSTVIFISGFVLKVTSFLILNLFTPAKGGQAFLPADYNIKNWTYQRCGQKSVAHPTKLSFTILT
jgi:hypothetical protein